MSIVRGEVRPPVSYWKLALYCVIGVIIAALLLIGGAAGCKEYQRYQKRADANNRTELNAIKIHQTEQLIEVAKKEAEIRYQRSLGVKRAQKEVATTLTPLFVQYEMITALDHIASSGKNNTVVYIPAGANGVPLVSVSDKPQVFGGEAEE